jgi:hypothetical protein
MRDDHLDHFHSQDNIQTGDLTTVIVGEELKNLCFDLIRADNVAGMLALAPAHQNFNENTLRELFECLGKFASPEMLPIIRSMEISPSSLWSYVKPLFRGTANSNNTRLLEYLTNRDTFDTVFSGRYTYHDIGDIFVPEVLRNGNHEMLDMMSRWIEQDVKKKKPRPYLVSAETISATSHDFYREQLLLGLWKKVPKRCWNNHRWKNALMNVASATCSARLAQFLLEQHIPVDWRPSKACSTALLHAVRKTSAAAANLAKTLLFNGANTMVIVQRSVYDREIKGIRSTVVEAQVSKEKGAQQISQWLGVTWDELVAQVEKERQQPTDANDDTKARQDGT